MSQQEHDMMIAYRISCKDVLSSSLPNYNLLLAAIKSQQTPRQISSLARKIGMIIPIPYRYGINTYAYFLQNFLDYLEVIHLSLPSSFPNPEKKLHLYGDDVLIRNIKKEDKYLWKSRKHLEELYLSSMREKKLYQVDWTNQIYTYYPTNRCIPTETIISIVERKEKIINLAGEMLEIPKVMQEPPCPVIRKRKTFHQLNYSD